MANSRKRQFEIPRFATLRVAAARTPRVTRLCKSETANQKYFIQ